jgi:hypothetical protein
MRVPNLDLTSTYSSLMLDMMFCGCVQLVAWEREKLLAMGGYARCKGECVASCYVQKDLLTTV